MKPLSNVTPSLGQVAPSPTKEPLPEGAAPRTPAASVGVASRLPRPPDRPATTERQEQAARTIANAYRAHVARGPQPADSNPTPVASAGVAAKSEIGNNASDDLTQFNDQQNALAVQSMAIQTAGLQRSMVMQGLRDLIKDAKETIKDTGEAGHKA